MEQYHLSTQRYTDQVKHSIDSHNFKLGIEEKRWEVTKVQQESCFIYGVGRKEKKNAGEYMASIASDIVQQEVIQDFAKKYLKERHDLEEKDKEQIKKLFFVSNYLTQEEGVSYISYYLVYVPLLRVIEAERGLNIDGWIRFRTKQYRTILKDLIEQVIYDYQIQKEYLEFIELLKETRKLHESSEGTLHLVILPNNQMYILDEHMKEVTQSYIHKYSNKELKEKGVTREDLIMNVFILGSPEKVVIHNRGEQTRSFVETLEAIFQNEIIYCNGCEYCKDASKYGQVNPLE
ncbi:MAG: sporulation protein YtxC [Cellulosilyticaceae bacterium]